MTLITWKTDVDGDWTTGAAWIGNVAPTTGNDALIDASGDPDAAYTVTIAAAEAVTVHSATLDHASATLAVKGTLTLAGATPSLQVLAGAVLLSGTIAGGTVQLGANALSVSGAARITGALDAAAGVINIAAGTTFTLANGGSLDNGEQIIGPGTLATSGTLTEGPGGLDLDGNLVWNNSGTVRIGAQLNTDFPSNSGTVTINNLAGAAFDLTGDGGAFYVGDTTHFNNIGTLAKTAGTGSSNVSVAITNTGTLSATTGTLELDGGGTFGAKNTITGAGVVALGGAGTFTLAGTTAVVTGALALNGGVVQIDVGKTLTLSGENTWGTGTQIDGPGTLLTTGATTFTSQPQMDGSLVWNNSGTVNAGAQLATDYTSNAGTMTINNLATGAFDLTVDGSAIYVGINGATTFNNAGVLAKTGGTGTSTFTDAIANTSTGTITASTGTLELDGGAPLAGKIGATGAGMLAFNFGTFTVAGATATVTGALALTGGLVQIDTGKTLTLTGATTWGGGTQINGPGTLVTTGAIAYANQPQLDGSLVWINSGTVTAGSQIATDYPDNAGAMTINNLAGGVIDFTSDAGIYVGVPATTVVHNTGTLAKTDGDGVSTVAAAVFNTGTLAASSGTLELDGGGNLAGTIVQTSTGAVHFGGGVFAFSGAVAAAGPVTFVNGATLAVGAVSGTISSASVLESAVTIAAGKTLTLSGATTWGTGTQINGPGTLVTTGATGFATDPHLDGSLVWNNSGVVTDDAQLDTNYPSNAGSVTINNLATGDFNIISDDVAIYIGAPATTQFNNTGTLAKTGGTGTTNFLVPIANTGTITATTGTLDLTGGGTFGAKNPITGAGLVELGGGTFTLAGTTASITGALTLAGGVLQIDAGKTLTLSGPTTWTGGTQINGPGTLVTTGATGFIANAQLDGSLVWNNTGTVSDGAQLDTSYPSNSGTVAINNLPAGVFDLTADGLGIYVGGTTFFNNTGTLAKTAGSGISSINASLNSNGTLTAATGTLELDGGGTFGANTVITGAGKVVINTGTYTVAATTGTVTGALALNGGLVQLDAGKTLTLSGPNAWGSGTQIDGPGTLATGGITSFTASPNLDGNLVWNNSGTVNAAVQIDTDNPSNIGTVTINNLFGGHFNLTADGVAIYVGPGATTNFNNAGLLAKTAGIGTTTIATAVNNTGSITATSGTLELDGGGTLDGGIGGGTGNGVVVLSNGANFVSTGNNGFVVDAGLKSNMRIINGATWSDNGFLEAEGHIQIGNGTGISALVIGVNDSLRFTADDGGIVNGTGSTLINNGELGKTAGTGTSTIGMGFSNTGTVLASSGTLKLGGAVIGSGVFLINPAAALELASGAIAGSNTVDMNGLGATLKIDNNSTVAKPIIGLGAGDRIDLAAAASVATVINGNTLTITPTGGAALKFVSTTSLTGLLVTTATDSGGAGTLVSLITAPPPIVTTNLSPSASNAVKAVLGTAVTGFGSDAISVTLTSDADFPITGAGASTVVLNSGGTLLYTPGLVTQSLITSADTIKYTVTDTVTGVVTKETQLVSLDNGPAPVVTVAAHPAASNVVNATLGTAVTGRAGDALNVSLFSDADFASGSTVVLNNGTLVYDPGLVTAALVGTDSIVYNVSDAVTGAVTEVTQTVTLSNGSPPIVTLVANPTASNSTTAKLATATPGVGTDALSVTLNSDADFASGSKIVLNNGTLTYTPGLVTAALAGSDTIKYTVTDTVTGGTTAKTQIVTLSNAPGPVVTLAAAPAASNAIHATLGTAVTGHAADPLSVALTADADFASGSTVVLNNGTLIYTPGLVTAAKVGADSISYSVTDTVTGAMTNETQSVTLSNGPAPVVTLAATPSASNSVAATLGSVTGRIGDALTVTLTSDSAFASGSSVALTGATLSYTPGLVTTFSPGSDTIKYTVTDTVTGAVVLETQNVALSNGPPPIVTLAASPTASNSAAGKLGTAVTGHASDALSVTLISDADFATGSKIVLNNGTLVYTPGPITAGLAGADTIKYAVTDTVTGAATAETQTVTLVSTSPPIVTLAATPTASNALTAKLGTAAPAVGTDALSVTLTSDADFATGSKIVLNNGTLTYTPGLVTTAKVGADTIKYTVTDTVTGGTTTETQTVTLSNGPGPVVTLAATPTATNVTTATLGTAVTGHATDALSVTLTADAKFTTGSKVVLTNGNLVYTPGAITPAKAGSDTISYTVTDTVTGAVTKETQAVTIFDSILTLTAAPTTVVAAQEISNFIATDGVLNSRDNLTGGPNNPNMLTLSGGGVFDLNAPKVLTNIQDVNATEGQAAFVSGSTTIANTGQIIFMRDGLATDVVVAPGVNNASNPNLRGITIYGGNDSSVINLGAGNDKLVLGGAGERVFGGTGTSLVQGTAAFAGTQVIGAATGVTTLELTSGGTATMNVNSAHVTVKLDAATVLTLSKATFVTALGSAGNDSITAGTTAQVLTGGAGVDTLTGFSGFGDTFSDTSAGLNGDMLKLFGGSDKIDLTDMAFGTLKPLAFAAGALTVANAAHTAKINFTGSYALAHFHAATDTHTGTLITFVP